VGDAVLSILFVVVVFLLPFLCAAAIFVLLIFPSLIVAPMIEKSGSGDAGFCERYHADPHGIWLIVTARRLGERP
jgi:hypothetical protein